MRKALIFYGGWEGHEPEILAGIISKELSNRGFEIRSEGSLNVLENGELLKSFDLIVPCWTMGEIKKSQLKNLSHAIRSGTGLGGFHGGMGDAFRGNTEYEWMVGGHFVGHPHVGDYNLRNINKNHPITEKFPSEMQYNSEQYYLLVDPGNTVLVETTYSYDEGSCDMPVVWIKQWGRGRVFYSALGHNPTEFTDYPEVLEMTLDGMCWASRNSINSREQ